jgi:hypothetical protein
MDFLKTFVMGLGLLALLPCRAADKMETVKSDTAKRIRNTIAKPAYDALFSKDFLLHDIARQNADNWDDAFAQIHQFVQTNDAAQVAVAQRIHNLGNELLKIVQDIVQYDVIRARDGKGYQINFGRAAKRVLDWSTSHDQELDKIKEELEKTLAKHRASRFTGKEKGDASGLLIEAIKLLEKASETTAQELATLKTNAYAMKDVMPGTPDYQKARIVIKETV